MRESTKEASSLGIKAQCEEWYGVRDIPWLQLALEWTGGGRTKESAKERFVNAYDGSELADYDIQRKSSRSVEFDTSTHHSELEALPVRAESDRRPDDLNRQSELLGGQPPSSEEINQVLGALDVKFDAEANTRTGLPEEIGSIDLGWENVDTECLSVECKCLIQNDSFLTPSS